MATPEELTTQCIAMTKEIKELRDRLVLAEQEIVRRGGPGVSHEHREDEKRLFPELFEEKTPFRDFA